MGTIHGKARALVLEQFNRPFVLKEFPMPKVGGGEVLAKVTAAGVCGSDLHMYEGKDPRTPLPIIPGHEGVGEAVVVGDGATLHDGSPIKEGMPIVWERSLTCGECYFCKRGQKYLCTSRKVYGINISSAEPPHLSGNYATHILLRKGTAIYPIEEGANPEVYVPATCSGSTAAHAHEYSGIKGGETVVIYGSGPVAIFQIAYALDSGAKWVSVVTRTPGPKSEIAKLFGASEVLFRSEIDSQAITKHMLDRTNGIGVDIVIDTTPDPRVFEVMRGIIRRGGVYVNPGLAVPGKPVEIELYRDVVNKNLAIHGVWASDETHLEKALNIVKSGKFPFEKLITHRFPLDQHEEAWRVLKNKEAVKVVFRP
jgi:threonine dehydrogenase-like Zn-dependent dehydrogenase